MTNTNINYFKKNYEKEKTIANSLINPIKEKFKQRKEEIKSAQQEEVNQVNNRVTQLAQGSNPFAEDNFQSTVSIGGGEVEKKENPEAEITTPEYFTDSQTGEISGVRLPNGKTFFGNKEDILGIVQRQQDRTSIPENLNIAPVGTAQAQLNQQIQAIELAGQVGQFNQLGVSPNSLDYQEALTTSLVSSIPRALSYAVSGGVAGAFGIGGASGGTLAAPVALVGAVVGFTTGITSGIISNMKKQRTDSTNAQKRVLEEGKQNLNDWITLAAQDPTNRQIYIANFNKQLALIDQAYRQMKLDTSRDLAKFETAVPDLAEFESFYSAQGERDFLIADMQNSLLNPSNLDYKILDLANRYP